MSEYTDIVGPDQSNSSYGLVYTKKCGWIDLGHAQPDNAKKLLSEFCNKRKLNWWQSWSTWADSKNYFPVYFSVRQTATSSGGGPRAQSGVSETYLVKRGFSKEFYDRVALAIYMGLSKGFEEHQSNWLVSFVTDSGYSAEDLVSNLIGFYGALYPETDFIKKCEPVSKDLAQRIWKRHGSVEKNKNRTFKPYIFHDGDDVADERKRLNELPAFLRKIKPAKVDPGHGDLYVWVS